MYVTYIITSKGTTESMKKYRNKGYSESLTWYTLYLLPVLNINSSPETVPLCSCFPHLRGLRRSQEGQGPTHLPVSWDARWWFVVGSCWLLLVSWWLLVDVL